MIVNIAKLDTSWLWVFAAGLDSSTLLSIFNSILTKRQLQTLTRFPTMNTLKTSQTRSLNHHQLLYSARKYTMALVLHWSITFLTYGNVTESSLQGNLQNDGYYPFWTHEEYKYSLCGINKKGMKAYYDNILKDKNTTLHVPSLTNWNVVQRLMGSMPDDQTLGVCTLPTPDDISSNNNHQYPFKCWSGNIIPSLR